MTLKERIKKPDSPFWKKVGNFAAIVAAPAGTLAILVFVPDPFKQTAIATWSALMAAVKGLTKLSINIHQ